MGSSRSDQKLTKETYPIPKTKAGFPALIREVLDQPGAVERILMENGQPVRVWRWVESNELIEDPDVSLDSALSACDIIEYSNPDPGRSSAEELMHMLMVLESERHFPVCWATGRGEGLLEKWLEVDERGVPFKGDTLFHIPIERLKSLPEDTLLLCGSEHPNGDHGEVTLAIKTALEIREVHDVQEKEAERHAARGGDPAQERAGPVRETSNGSGGHGRPAWNAPRFLREGFGGGRTVR